MIYRFLSVSIVALVLLATTAKPALAQAGSNYFSLEVDATCACDYQVTAWGWTPTPFQAVHIDYSFHVLSGGVDYTIINHLDGNSDSNGAFKIQVSGLTLPGDCKNAFTFSNGTASGTGNGNVIPLDQVFLVDTPVCQFPPPPPGKTFDIGPSSMEGHLLIRPGDWVSGGYSFVFLSGSHPDELVAVTSHMTLPFKCANGTTGSFVINLGTHNYFVPAGNKDWQPTGDANSVLSWAGSGQAPEGCGPGQIMDNSKGAIFEPTISQIPDTGQLLNWRFKYRDPNAKGKGNVNCLDTTDPRRDKADVCGASWSGTVTDP